MAYKANRESQGLTISSQMKGMAKIILFFTWVLWH